MTSDTRLWIKANAAGVVERNRQRDARRRWTQKRHLVLSAIRLSQVPHLSDGLALYQKLGIAPREEAVMGTIRIWTDGFPVLVFRSDGSYLGKDVNRVPPKRDDDQRQLALL